LIISSMISIEEITNPISVILDAYEKRLSAFLEAENDLIYQATSHLLSSTGKRLRPATLFLSSAAFGCQDDKMVAPAIALEMIHNATLLHDDVIDQSRYRRGKETVNYHWSNLVAVLMGDYFFAKAFKILVYAGRQDLLDAVSSATERVSIGELGQVQELHNMSLTEEAYLSIISNKTASLFSCAGQCGAMIAGTNGENRKSLYNYGENLGIAFQIADDLLDFVGDERKLGKGVGSDLKEGWFTLPLIYSLGNSSPDAAKTIKEILANGFHEEQFPLVRDFVHESGGIEYSKQRATAYRDRALESLTKIEDSIYKSALIKLAEFTVLRER